MRAETQRPSEKPISDGLCRCGRVCRPEATHAFHAAQRIRASPKSQTACVAAPHTLPEQPTSAPVPNLP
ncbi:TPA: hypothetical protein ACFNMI_001398 [Neisseria bacilliformis]|uniref:hypothetical protein n=1 Tax=Neisseria bacilliformis TaxID=267212 RepID=UPI001364B2F1|nr:hypothetical protein [Neisseria bacilliformis]